MARPLSRDLRERVVGAVLEEGLSRNRAAARFGVAVSTANLWVKLFQATGSLDHGQIGGHKPATLSGAHRDWLLARCKGGAFTLRGLVAELGAERGLKVDYVSVWRFVHAEGLTHKKRRYGSCQTHCSGLASGIGQKGGAMKIRLDEIRAGIAVHLEPAVLVQLPDTLTTATEQTVVNRKGYFLILEPYYTKRWLCAALYGEKEDKPDRHQLEISSVAKKEGHPSWTDRDSFYSELQFWAITSDDIATASENVEYAHVGARNSYALADSGKATLAAIAALSKGMEFRHISRLPVL